MSDATQQGKSIPSIIQTVFLDHPASVDETFWQHFRFALTFSFWLFVAAFAALIHALIPALCKTTGSDIIKRLHARIVNRVPH
jgi:hypothetical protein